MKYAYKTKDTCSSGIFFDINRGVVTNIEFLGGCNGNLKAISKLLDGWKAEEIAKKCLGNTCGQKNTSCVDQLAKAVMMAAEKEREDAR